MVLKELFPLIFSNFAFTIVITTKKRKNMFQQIALRYLRKECHTITETRPILTENIFLTKIYKLNGFLEEFQYSKSKITNFELKAASPLFCPS